MMQAIAIAAAGAVALGCSSATTLRIDLQAAPGVTVQTLSLRVGLPGGRVGTQALPPGGGPPRLPGRVVVKLPDLTGIADVALDGVAGDGRALHAGGTVPIVQHAQASASFTLGEAAPPNPDLSSSVVVDLAAPTGSDLACTLGARCAYAFRRPLTITNGAAAALPAGYTVRVPLDPLLFSPAKVRSDLADVRLFVESSGVELDRVLDLAPPGQDRALWLALQDPIAPGATDAR